MEENKQRIRIHPEKLTAAYNQGRETALRHLDELKAYLDS